MQETPTLAEVAVREVRAEMARKRKSGEAIAQELGVSGMYLSRRLSGAVPLDLVDLERIARVLDVPPLWFLNAAPAGDVVA